jgi:hypothetical protein
VGERGPELAPPRNELPDKQGCQRLSSSRSSGIRAQNDLLWQPSQPPGPTHQKTADNAERKLAAAGSAVLTREPARRGHYLDQVQPTKVLQSLVQLEEELQAGGAAGLTQRRPQNMHGTLAVEWLRVQLRQTDQELPSEGEACSEGKFETRAAVHMIRLILYLSMPGTQAFLLHSRL